MTFAKRGKGFDKCLPYCPIKSRVLLVEESARGWRRLANEQNAYAPGEITSAEMFSAE
jgi:hypothetical protein